jgi:general secretion pathway protein G
MDGSGHGAAGGAPARAERRDERRGAGRSAFTLIEVLLVVAILGILAAIVVVSVGGRREEAMIQATRASIANVCAAIDLYEVDTGRYPPSLDSLVQNDGAPNWHGPYVKGGAPADAWGTTLNYSTAGKTYKVSSAGPDQAHGGGDDLSN